MNFSFLENRCDLILDPALSQDLAVSVCNALCFGVSDTYLDFEPNVNVMKNSSHSAEGTSAKAARSRGGYENICVGYRTDVPNLACVFWRRNWV